MSKKDIWPIFFNGVNFKLHAIFMAKCQLQSSTLRNKNTQIFWSSKLRIGLDIYCDPFLFYKRYLRKCSNEQRMITLSTLLFLSPANIWFNTLDWNNAAQTAEQQAMLIWLSDNGFNVVQNRRPCSLSWGTSNGPSSHWTFSFELS